MISVSKPASKCSDSTAQSNDVPQEIAGAASPKLRIFAMRRSDVGSMRERVGFM